MPRLAFFWKQPSAKRHQQRAAFSSAHRQQLQTPQPQLERMGRGFWIFHRATPRLQHQLIEAASA